MVKLLKEYYQSRRATLVGALTLPVGLMAMFIIGFPEHLIIVAAIGLGLTIYGASVGIWGIGHWIESSSEMKALNVVVSTQNSPDAGRTKLDTSRIPLASALGVQYSTDPIEPGSVTEQTTRQLDERVSQPSLPGQSE